MPPPPILLHEVLQQIIDTSVARLDAARALGGLLDGVNGIVSGDRTRRRPAEPYVWLTIVDVIEEQDRGIHTTPRIRLSAAALVADDDPETAWLESMLLAARARSVLLADRHLGLDFVHKVTGVRTEPIGRIQQGRRFASRALLDVSLTIKEV